MPRKAISPKTKRPGKDDVHAARRRTLARRLARENVQAALIACPEDVSYLTGFTGAGSVLLGSRWCVLITDTIHREQALAECSALEVHVGSPVGSLKRLLRGRGVRRLGICGEKVVLTRFLSLQDAVGSQRVMVIDDLVAELRLTKDATELRAMGRAARAAERAFLELTSQGRKAFVGRSERAVAAELDHRMRLAGAEGPSFESVVAAGAATSRPHHRPRNRTIRRDEPVLIDWGAKVDGYCSDLTRVVFTGRISPTLAEVYEVVRRAQAAGMRALKPGAKARSADLAARDVIGQAGYADEFIHSVGHGLGRDVHEGPPLISSNVARLRPGMVVTVEPGIYLPGVGGIRIEDDVAITPTGRRRLSSLPVDIQQMVLR